MENKFFFNNPKGIVRVCICLLCSILLTVWFIKVHSVNIGSSFWLTCPFLFANFTLGIRFSKVELEQGLASVMLNCGFQSNNRIWYRLAYSKSL